MHRGGARETSSRNHRDRSPLRGDERRAPRHVAGPGQAVRDERGHDEHRHGERPGERSPRTGAGDNRRAREEEVRGDERERELEVELGWRPEEEAVEAGAGDEREADVNRLEGPAPEANVVQDPGNRHEERAEDKLRFSPFREQERETMEPIRVCVGGQAGRGIGNREQPRPLGDPSDAHA